MAKDGFILVAGTWIKMSIRGMLNFEHLEGHFQKILKPSSEKEGFINALRERIALTISSKKISDIADLERMLWPVKIIGTNLPVFIIPIKPEWAKNLFDEHMASQYLFGLSDLILNAEMVYYRAKKPSGLIAPARILWYASNKKDHPEAGSIRAVSMLEEVDIGTAKQLYSKYRRLGVYKWKDVLGVAKNDFERQIMALRFSNTYMLDRPLYWRELKAVLQKFGKKTTLQSPLRIAEDIFSMILKETTTLEGVIDTRDSKNAINVR